MEKKNEAFEAIVHYELKSRFIYLENNCLEISGLGERYYKGVCKNRER